MDDNGLGEMYGYNPFVKSKIDFYLKARSFSTFKRRYFFD